jgi:protein involved in polysaccharide export with SLBB domain
MASAGCARLLPPVNATAQLYDPEKSFSTERRSLSFVDTSCPPPGTTGHIEHGDHPTRRKPRNPQLMQPKYSPGDRLNVFVLQSPEYGGDYVIGPNGTITLPYAGEVQAAGTTTTELVARVERALVRARLFKDEAFRVAIRPVAYSVINTTISGAVFQPGRHAVGFVKDTEKTEKLLTRFGDNPADRSLGALLRAAGGIRPDADLAHIKLVRGTKTYSLDWRGALVGYPVEDVILIEGDHVEVPEAGCFQSGLVRPSQITPQGIRIFISNLTQPALHNNNSSVGQFTLGTPYGTRFLQGLVTANCVGGSLASNAHRYGVLISRNPKTLQTEVIQRSIEDLVRSPDRDTINPYLMPDDAIACYDSGVTDLREIAATVQALILPAQTYTGAVNPK